MIGAFQVVCLHGICQTLSNFSHATATSCGLTMLADRDLYCDGTVRAICRFGVFQLQSPLHNLNLTGRVSLQIHGLPLKR
jgi:hypothetical protein